MHRNRFSSQLPTDISKNRTLDPNNIKTPVIENTPNNKPEHFVTKSEKTVEHVDAPVLVTEYKFTVQKKVELSSPAHAQTRFSLGQQRRTSPPISEPMGKLVLANDKDQGVLNNTRDNPKSLVGDHNSVSQEKVEPMKDYKAINNKWDKPLTTVPDHKYSPFGDQTYGSPRKSYGVTDEKRDKPSTLVRDSGYNSPTKKVDETKSYNYLDDKWGKTTNPVQERPKQVNEFITKAQTETNRATRPGFLNGRNWRSNGGVNGHGEYTTYTNNDMDKPIIDSVRYERVVEPYIVGRNGWEGPSKREWAIPSTQVTPIFGPTNDIGEAVYILKEAVKSASPPQYNFNIRDTYTGSIDRREAQRKHGNPNLSVNPFPHYITSTEAERKYGGAPV